MRIVFSQIFADSQESYVREKMERSFQRQMELGTTLNSEELHKQAGSLVNQQLGTEVPILQPEAVYDVTPEQEAEIAARKRCVMGTLLREWPQIEGETIQEDFFTVLQQPFGALPANTAVLRRTTNMSEIYYLFDDVQIVDGNMMFIEPKPVPSTSAVPAKQASPGMLAAKGGAFTPSSIAKKIGGGLISGVAGTIGSLIFESIFPPGVPDYFDEVYKEIRNIVKQEFTAASITQINGRINGVIAWLRNTYKPRKEAGASRDELLGMVNRQVEVLYTEALYTLMDPSYAKPGLSVFMVAAGVHLVLMQEQALVDTLQADPAKSSFAKSVSLNAQTYYNHLMATADGVIGDRQKAVEIRYDPLVNQDPGSPYINTKARYLWIDNINQRRGKTYEEYTDKDKKYHSGREEAEADRQNYVTGMTNQFINDIGNPKELAGQWQQLTSRPIPKI